MSPLAIIILVLVIVGGVVSLVYVGVHRYAIRREQALHERFPSAKIIIPNANFLGQESKGVAQMRGNGSLVVTASELYFERWLPRKEFRIPLANIQSIETPKQFLGKRIGNRPLLKVVYRDESGQTDSMAWWVKDIESLKQLLEKQSV